MMLLCDTEGGSIVVRSRIKSGAIDLRSTKTYDALDQVVWAVLRKQIKPSCIAIDTLTTFTTTTRLDMVIDPANVQPGSLWAQRGRMTASQRDWGEMSDMTIRLLRMLRDWSDTNNVPSILVCHEGEREDPVTGLNKQGPDLNAMLLKDVYALTDMVLRLSLTQQDIKSKSGTTYPAGTRELRLAPNPSAMAKSRIPDDVPNPSPIILDPTWEKLVDAFGGEIPPKITLYGASGVGKTRLLGSAADYYAKTSQTTQIAQKIIQNVTATSQTGK